MADTGAVYFDAEKIFIRMCARQSQQVFAVAETDFQCAFGVASEDFLKIKW